MRISALCGRATVLARQKFRKPNACACSKVAGQLRLACSRPWQIATGKAAVFLGSEPGQQWSFFCPGCAELITKRLGAPDCPSLALDQRRVRGGSSNPIAAAVRLAMRPPGTLCIAGRSCASTPSEPHRSPPDRPRRSTGSSTSLRSWGVQVQVLLRLSALRSCLTSTELEFAA